MWGTRKIVNFPWLLLMLRIQCWDRREQLPAQTLKFCSTLGQGRGKEGKKRGSSLSNTFDDDCRCNR